MQGNARAGTSARGRAGGGRGVAGRALVTPRRRAESGRRFVGQGDRHLLAADALVVAHTSSGAEALVQKAPRAEVVAAFNSVPSEVLFGVFESRGSATPPSLVYCGDTQTGKRLAARLSRYMGFDPVDVGPLRIALYIEPFALLVAQLAYDGQAGLELACRFEWFQK